VALDEREGVVKRRFFAAMLRGSAWILELLVRHESAP
jgi:hypothetical protein